MSLLPDRVFRVNRQGDNLDFKGTEEDLERGLRWEDVIGSNVRQWVEPEVAETILAAIARALDTGTQQTVEYQVPIAWEPNKGELRDYEARLVVCGENEVLAIERDITDRKRSEAALRQSEERNSALLNAIPDLMFRIRQDGTYLDARADQASDLAIPPQAMIGRTVYEMLPPEVAQQRMHYLKLALETGETQLFEYQFLVHGEWRDYEARMVVSGADEVLAIMRDITERKHAERQLKSSMSRQSELYQQLQRLNASLEQQVEERTAQLQQNMQELQALSNLKDEFLHAVSHDLRTPIMGMRLVLQNLQNKATDSVALSRSVIDRMVQSLDRQLAMLNSLLEAHFSDLRGVSLQREWIQMEALIQTIAIDLEPLLLQHQASLEQQISATLPRLWADSGQIRRVFENLITNALQHNLPGLKITLQLTLEDAVIRCQVQDNGVGMRPDECESMFDRYVQGSRSRRSAGIGLGLYLCKQIVTAHGGAIGVSSQLGQGATFWFTLPLTVKATDLEATASVPQEDGNLDHEGEDNQKSKEGFGVRG